MVKGTIPKTYKEALNLLQNHEFTVIAGGTDLMVKRRKESGLLPQFNKDVLFISGLKELHYIKREKGYIHIGANVTLEDLKSSECTPIILRKAVASMASPAIRHAGTIGGNLGNASPAGDSLPPFYLLDAEIVLDSYKGERRLPIEEFITGPGQTALENHELIKEIVIKEKDFNYCFYEKVGGRKADAISKVSFTGIVSYHKDVVEAFRVAFGAVGPKVVRVRQLEKQIEGLTLKEIKGKKEWIKNNYEPSITPIDDQRSTAQYRKTCSLNLLDYFIENM